MACEQIADLIDVNQDCAIQIQQGESMNIEGTLVDGDNVAIPKSGLGVFKLTLFDEVSNSIINSRNEQSVKDANGGTVATDGSFVIRLEPDDAPIKSGSDIPGDIETHIARIKWTWDDSVAIRTGIVQVRIRVGKLGG